MTPPDDARAPTPEDGDLVDPDDDNPDDPMTDESGDDSDDEADDHRLVDAPSPGRLALVVAIVLAVVVSGLVWVLATGGESTDRAAYSTLIDRPAPEIVGDDLLGEASFDLADHEGRWVVVNFFATWCPPCIQEHPELIAFDEAYGPEGTDQAALVSVVFDESADVATQFFADEGGEWPVLGDPGGSAALDYGVLSVPETYLVDPDGIVRQKLIGGVTQAGLATEIAELEADLTAPGGSAR